MIKFARFLFVIAILVSLIGGASLYLSLTQGDKLLSNSAFAGNTEVQAKLDQAKAQLAELRAHPALPVSSIVAGLVAAILGWVFSKQRSRGSAFFVFAGLSLAFAAFAIATKSWIPGIAALLGLLFAFLKLLSLTKGGAVLPED